MTLQQLEIEMPPNISTAIAAKIMGKSQQFVRAGLVQKKLPFGVAVEMGRMEFYINTVLFIKYMKGE